MAGFPSSAGFSSCSTSGGTRCVAWSKPNTCSNQPNAASAARDSGMPHQSQFEPGLHRILWTLRDYSAELIVIGGWVPHLYHKYGGFRGWTTGLSRTGEVDVLVPAALPAVNRPPISNLLHAA